MTSNAAQTELSFKFAFVGDDADVEVRSSPREYNQCRAVWVWEISSVGKHRKHNKKF